MAENKRGRPADVLVVFNGHHYKVEPNASKGLFTMISRNDSPENKREALELVGARKILIGEAVDLDNLDKAAALGIATRMKKAAETDSDED
jgi:hypothetical protein